MADEETHFELHSPTSFEWNDQKGELNIAKHGIDFEMRLMFSLDRSFFADRTAMMRSAGLPWVIRTID
jgi:hypothetical protein